MANNLDRMFSALSDPTRRAVIERLSPTNGVEEVRVTDEDEYFPPPRNLRELLGAIDAVTQLTLGGAERAPLDDRSIDASDVLESLAESAAT